jgi:uncharacterized protein (DUF2141 family)
MIDPNSGQAKQSGITVTVSPTAATVNLSSTQQFNATVLNSTATSVSWSVNAVPGGNATSGTVSASGLYTAPSILPSPAGVTVEAASNSTPSAFGTASVTLVPSQPVVTVTVSPSSSSLQTGRSERFTATVSGTANHSVTWEVNGLTGGSSAVGTITAAGAYTAPAAVPSGGSVTITALSIAAPASSGQAKVTITRRR